MFITFEGIEGCGKTTQLARLAKFLKDSDVDIIVTREPGGTEFGEAVRRLLLDPSFGKIEAVTELYLLLAVRCQHVNNVIKPALSSGKIVLCDRYGDSTIAYQIGGRGLGRDLVMNANKWAVAGVEPNLTFLFDCPVDVGLSRANKRSIADRMESEARDFHERVRKEYLNIYNRNPERVVLIDAAKPEEDVWQDLMRNALERIECLKKY